MNCCGLSRLFTSFSLAPKSKPAGRNQPVAASPYFANSCSSPSSARRMLKQELSGLDLNFIFPEIQLKQRLAAAVNGLCEVDLSSNPSSAQLITICRNWLNMGMLLLSQFEEGQNNGLAYGSIKTIVKQFLLQINPLQLSKLYRNLSLLEQNLMQVCGMGIAYLPLYASASLVQDVSSLSYHQLPTVQEVLSSHRYYKAALLMLSSLRLTTQIAAGGENKVLPVVIENDGGFLSRNLVAPLATAMADLAKRDPRHALFNPMLNDNSPMTNFLRRCRSKVVEEDWRSSEVAARFSSEGFCPGLYWDDPVAYATFVGEQISI